jgi:hypothetical protein
VGIWDDIKDMAKDFHQEIIKPGAEVYNLLQMSESSGMTHLRIRVPQLIRDGLFDDFISMLRQISYNQDAPEDHRQKARKPSRETSMTLKRTPTSRSSLTAVAPDPGHHPQGRQGRHHPAGPDRPHCVVDQPGVGAVSPAAGFPARS